MNDRKRTRKILIVGGVAGGAGAAARLRRNDESAEIIMLEKGPYISYANCGLPYYIGNVITDPDDLLVQSKEGFSQRFDVDVRTESTVLSVNPKEKYCRILDQKTGKEYDESYDSLILSPGASPIRPQFPGSDLPHVFTLRTVPDTLRIREFLDVEKPKTAAIIGGGFIGVEMAENLVHQGVSVSVIEAADHLIGAIDTDMSYDLHNYVRSQGVALYIQESAAEIKRNAVILKSGGEIPADLVILSIGVIPETAFLRDSGLALGPRGQIIVDESLRTNLADVYALGDAISVKTFTGREDAIIPLASPANKQARIVADVISGINRKYDGSQGTAIAKVFDMSVAVTGESEKSLTRIGKEYLRAYAYPNSHAGYYPGAEPMFVKLLFSPGDGKVLGAQITGFSLVDKRIDVLATAIRAGMTVYDLEEIELSYAPPFSSAKDPVNMVSYVAENILSGKTNPFYLSDLDSLDKNAFLLDTRTPGEFARGTIPGAVNIPLDTLREHLDELPKDKDIYITCQVGLRGYLAERILKNNGFRTFNLQGGYRHFKARSDDREHREKGKVSTAPCGMEKESIR